jgi:hypothetical protein
MAYRSDALARADQAEWSHADRREHVEYLEERVSELTVELERIKTELTIARLWVKELALWLDTAPPKQNVLRRGISSLREECGLCGHTRLWHYVHMISWGRD